MYERTGSLFSGLPIFFAKFYKRFHIICQKFALMINDIQISPDWLIERNLPDRPLFAIFFYNKIGENRYAEPFGNSFDECLRACALPSGGDCDLLQRESGVEQFTPGAAFLTHKEGETGKLGKRYGFH